MDQGIRMRMNPKVDGYLRKAKKWREEFEKLRMIILDCQLTEELKCNRLADDGAICAQTNRATYF